MSILVILRYINIACIIFAIIVWRRFAKRYPRYTLLTVAPIAWLIHALLYYLFVIFFSAGNQAMINIWSSTLRLHAILTFALIGMQISLEYKP
jgi:hypothetical protein